MIKRPANTFQSIKETTKIISGYGIPLLKQHLKNIQIHVKKEIPDKKLYVVKNLVLKPSCSNEKLSSNVACVYDANQNGFLFLRDTFKIANSDIDVSGPSYGSVLIGPNNTTNVIEYNANVKNYQAHRTSIQRLLNLCKIEHSYVINNMWISKSYGFVPMWAFHKQNVRLSSLIGSYQIQFRDAPDRGRNYL